MLFFDNKIKVDFNPTNSYNETNTSLYVALKNPFRYRSYYYDTETNLYYLNSRYYDPEIGRFINIDEISVLSETQDTFNGLNLFAYCHNNPVSRDDEYGYFFWFCIIAIAAGAIISAGADIITQGITKGWNNINWGQVGWSALIGALGGALMASGVGAIGMTILGGALGFVDSVGYQLIGGASFSEINWLSVGLSTVLGALPGILGQIGLTNKNNLGKYLAKSIDYQKATNSLWKVTQRLGTSYYKTIAGAKRALTWAQNNLSKITTRVINQGLWRSLGVDFLKQILTSFI